jgi:hypothetical protein
MIAYEELLERDPVWAMSEGSRHFDERSAVQQALRKIACRLDELGIPYAVSGGMALFGFGLRRFTEDVDILVTPEGLKSIHKRLEGLGYVPLFPGSKNLRDAELGVRIEFLVAGQYPGDGKEKPVRFPDPAAVSIEQNGIRYLNLRTLVELKLASGMTSPERMRDLADVQELIKLLKLPQDYAAGLNPFVQAKFSELWKATRAVPKRYLSLWRNKFLTVDAKTIEEMIAALREAAATLEAMRRDGVTLDPEGVADDYAHLVTSDPDVARKYDMHEESEFWGEDDPEPTDTA